MDLDTISAENNYDSKNGEQFKEGVHSYRNKLKKRKKKFLANAKGFGKTGNFGRGTRLEGDEWSYFINIMDAIKQGFDSLDDKLSMAANVFEQTVEKEIHISSNQIACTILEYLMPFVDANILQRFQTTFTANFRPICSDKFASHILQKMIEVSFLRAVAELQPPAVVATDDNKDDLPPMKKQKIDENALPNEKEHNLNAANFDATHRQVCCEFVVKISKFLLNNLEDFVWDAYGCHLIRTCLLSLCGIFVFKKNNFISSGGQQQMEQHLPADKETPLAVPNDWMEIIEEYAIRLQAWPQFVEFPYAELSSGLLQILCLALKTNNKSTLKHLGKKLLNESFLQDVEEDNAEKSSVDESVVNKLPKVFTTEPSIRLLETILLVAGPKLLLQIYLKLFAGRLVQLSEMRSANFAVQKLLDSLKCKEEFDLVFDELAPNIENLLRIGHTGVVNALAQACLRICSKQGAFLQGLQTALHCTAPKEKSDKFAVLTMKLKPYEIATEDKSSFINLHGSLILQAMLHFNKPIKLVQCLLETNNAELCDIFCSPRGSHVVDAFLKSKAIGEKSREKFIKHMDGMYLNLAVSKHGSRAMEAMFESAFDNQRVRIVKELSEKVNQLNGSPTGRLLNRKFKVDLYCLSPAQWKAAFNKETKIEKLFKDIIQ